MAENREDAASSADFEEHQQTYDGVMRVTLIGVLHVLSIVVGLGIGGVAHHWGLAGFWMAVATIGAVLGLAFKGLNWRPGLVIFVIMLATLGTVTHAPPG